MVPPDLGEYTVIDRPDPGCGYIQSIADMWQERAPRRRDIGKPTWGARGVPTQTTMLGHDSTGILAATDTRPVEFIATEQGRIGLPYGASSDGTYMPSSTVLEALPFTGSRTSGISDRYYR